MFCDLHTHSIYSDGTYTPAELIGEAKRLGLIIALTDHNTAAGLAEFMAEAEAANVTAVAGVELSTDCGGTELHLLGLFIPRRHNSPRPGQKPQQRAVGYADADDRDLLSPQVGQILCQCQTDRLPAKISSFIIDQTSAVCNKM